MGKVGMLDESGSRPCSQARTTQFNVSQCPSKTDAEHTAGTGRVLWAELRLLFRPSTARPHRHPRRPSHTHRRPIRAANTSHFPSNVFSRQPAPSCRNSSRLLARSQLYATPAHASNIWLARQLKPGG